MYNYSDIHATGGGAFRFANVIVEEFGVKLEKHDEILSLVRGYTFMNRFNSFYEVVSEGMCSTVPPEDFVKILIKNKLGISSYFSQYWFWGKCFRSSQPHRDKKGDGDPNGWGHFDWTLKTSSKC